MGITQQIGASSLIKPGVIDNTSARPASPYEGQVIYQKDTDEILAYNGSSWTRPANMPWGKIAANYNATNYGLTTANVGFTVSSLTGTITAGRAYLVSAQLVFQPYVNACTQAMMYVTGSFTTRTLYYQNGVSTPAYTMIPMTGSQQFTATELGVTSGSTSVTLNLLIRTSTGGYVNEDPDGVLGANSSRANFRIEDIGPV